MSRKILALFIIHTIASYLIVTFITFELDPQEWHWTARALCAFIWVALHAGGKDNYDEGDV